MLFLLVACSQLIPELKIGELFTYFAPLAFVLSITIGKEAHDDYQRYKRDKEANSQRYERLGINGFSWIPSSDINVGDIIKVDRNQRVPADMILLHTTEKTGSCFIRTDQLDGETDWKLRIAVPFFQKLENFEATVLSLHAHIYAETPHKDIYSFVGNITRDYAGESMVESLNDENTMWANTYVASGSALGVVIYTGGDTKAALNTSFPSTKVGLLDLEINSMAKILCFVMFVLSFLSVALKNFQGFWYINIVRFMIMYSSIIPISLRVNLDMGKSLYAWWIMRDREIPNTIVRTSTIPEELGRVEYLLTDKTGTLTKNEMEMKKLHMGTLSFGTESKEEVVSHLENAFGQQKLISDYESRRRQKGRRDISTRTKDVVQALALCHNVRTLRIT
jgi:phospholipid-translocating ATPase